MKIKNNFLCKRLITWMNLRVYNLQHLFTTHTCSQLDLAHHSLLCLGYYMCWRSVSSNSNVCYLTGMMYIFNSIKRNKQRNNETKTQIEHVRICHTFLIEYYRTIFAFIKKLNVHVNNVTELTWKSARYALQRDSFLWI